MKIINSIIEIRQEIKTLRQAGKSIGFVPTMGYLHAGHQELMKIAKQNCDIVITSIFVNPLQFGPSEDFEKYPRDLLQDEKICIEASVDILFIPTAVELISQNLVYVEINELDKHLCGKSRPGHFRGVCTIVSKLFNIITPNKAFFGKKDIQQLQIIRQLVTDLDFNIEIIGVETVRTTEGLALSSRNSYLSPEEKQKALIVPAVIHEAYQEIKAGQTREIIIDTLIAKVNANEGCKVDYIEIVDLEKLQPADNYQQDLIIAAAIFVGKTRLIDNMLITGEQNHAN